MDLIFFGIPKIKLLVFTQGKDFYQGVKSKKWTRYNPRKGGINFKAS